MRSDDLSLPTTSRDTDTVGPDLTRQLLDDALKVMLVDNRIVMREGLRLLIEQQPDLSVVAQASTVGGAGSIEAAPDVIVTEVDLPDSKLGDVITGLRASFPGSAILVLSLVDHPAKVEIVLASGTDGYVLKTAAPTALLTGIRALAGGEKYVQPALGVELAAWRLRRETGIGLSPKEEDVLRLVALGHTNAEIAGFLGVSLRTAETHRSRIHHKLGYRTRAELVQYAQDLGLM